VKIKDVPAHRAPYLIIAARAAVLLISAEGRKLPPSLCPLVTPPISMGASSSSTNLAPLKVCPAAFVQSRATASWFNCSGRKISKVRKIVGSDSLNKKIGVVRSHH
jgi:hypothetical protein